MKKYRTYPETQIWVEDGKIMKEEIIRETGGEVDLTPHPTRARVLMFNGEIKSIDSLYAEEYGYTDARLMTEITVTAILKSIEYGKE